MKDRNAIYLTVVWLICLVIIPMWALGQTSTTLLEMSPKVAPEPTFFDELGMMEKILFLVMAFNIGISGLVSFLDFIKDKTRGDGDNKASVIAHKVLDILARVIDFLGANRKHK